VGESEQPHKPPGGEFDARLTGSDISIPGLHEGVVMDYRQGSVPFSGTHIHEIEYQVGTGTQITVSWVLPDWVSGSLQDFLGGVVVDAGMTGTGSCVVASPGIIATSTVRVKVVSRAKFLPPLLESLWQIAGGSFILWGCEW
jgi:hypothetical protein